MLLLVYAFNFIDRIMLGILVPPIKHEFALTDTELGLLGGTAFALFYTAAWDSDRLAGRSPEPRLDRDDRARNCWSAFYGRVVARRRTSPSCSRARLGVGIGEAGGVCLPPMH